MLVIKTGKYQAPELKKNSKLKLTLFEFWNFDFTCPSGRQFPSGYENLYLNINYLKYGGYFFVYFGVLVF
ncbi:MAG TPA: hypothetical protein DCG75_12840 [Bacteroidales bacterium]|nr:hypothetical protein [Bacteroidales bacterium]